ncbi:acetyl-coenzyme-A carboxylase [Blastocladiella emersonii ATCC 22665]|nr:acetyl-coenzyme-A carboxylase [Blastocladiella emersonii ATCC 22665]
MPPTAACKSITPSAKDNALDWSFFVRAPIRPSRFTPGAGQRSAAEYPMVKANRILTDALNALELAAKRLPNTNCNHLFLTLLSELPVSPDEIQDLMRPWKLRMMGAEIWLLCQPPTAGAESCTYRFLTFNVCGVIKAKRYREIKDGCGATS